MTLLRSNVTPVGIQAAAGTTALARQAAALQSGEWMKLGAAGSSGTAPVTGMTTPAGLQHFVRVGTSGTGTLPGSGGGLLVAYMDKLARDPNGKRIFAIGCDHGGASRNVMYDEATNAWTVIQDPMPWGIISGSGTTAHGYDHSFYDAIHDKLWHRPYASSGPRRWDGGTTWATPVSWGPGPWYAYSGTAVANGIDFFPEYGGDGQGRIIAFELENTPKAGLIQILPVAPYTVTNIIHESSGILQPVGNKHQYMRYSKARQLIYFGGGDSPGSPLVWTLNASGTVTAMPNVPAGITGTVGPAGQPTALPFVNPSNGNLVVMQGLNNWFELNPTGGGSWSAKSGSAQIMASNTAGGTNDAYGIASCEIPEYGVVCFAKNWAMAANAEMWLWRP